MLPQVKCNFVHTLLQRKFWIVNSVKGHTEVEHNIQPYYATTATHLYFSSFQQCTAKHII